MSVGNSTAPGNPPAAGNNGNSAAPPAPGAAPRQTDQSHVNPDIAAQERQRAHLERLPACLLPGGPLDQVLRQTAGPASQADSPRCLHAKIRSILNNMWQVLCFRNEDDPVLRLCIATASQQEISTSSWNEALRAYMQQPAEYRLVLADLLPQGLVANADRQIAHDAYHHGTNPTAEQDWDVFRERLEDQQNNRLRQNSQTLSTGLPKLDEALGGLSGLTFIGGDKGVGKTTLMLCAGLATLRSQPDSAVLFYSLDMPKERIYERILSHESGLDLRTIKSPSKSSEQLACIQAADTRSREMFLPRLKIIERNFVRVEVEPGESYQRDGLSASQVISDCNRLRNRTGATKLLLVFDLFQKIDCPESIQPSVQDIHRLDLLDNVKQRLHRDLGTNNFAILVSSETRKSDITQGHRRDLSRDDLKGDGRMASDADTILLIWPTESSTLNDESTVPLTLRIDKGRDGVHRRDIPLNFHHTVNRFSVDESNNATRQRATRRSSRSNVATTPAGIDPLGQ